MSVDQDIKKAADQLEADVKLTSDITHGDENSEIPTLGGTVPTLRKRLKDIETEWAKTADPLAEDLADAVQFTKGYKDAAGDSAQSASDVLPKVIDEGEKQVAAVISTGNDQLTKVTAEGNRQTERARIEGDRAEAGAVSSEHSATVSTEFAGQSESARDLSNQYRKAAETAKADAEAARVSSESAAEESNIQRQASEAAKNQSETARDEAQAAESMAIPAAINAESAQAAAEKARDDAEAIVYEGDATQKPTPGSIPISDSKGKIDNGWLHDQSPTLPDFHLPLVSNLSVKEGFADSVTLSRTTSGMYLRAGLFKTAEINNPRFEKTGLRLEGPNTNMCSDSELRIGIIGNEPWIKSEVQEPSLVGGWVSETWEFTGEIGTIARFRLAAVHDDDPGSARFGIFVKVENITKVTYGTDGSGHQSFSCVYDLVNETILERMHVTSSKMAYMGNGWWYLTHTTFSDTFIISNRHYIRCDEYTKGAKITVCNPHVQQHQFFDSIIPFGSQPTTRTADIADVVSDYIIPRGDFTLYVQVSVDGRADLPSQHILTAAPENRDFELRLSNKNVISGYIRQRAFSIDVDTKSGEPIKLAVRVKDDTADIFNLMTGEHKTFTGVIDSLTECTQLQLGRRSDNNEHLYGTIRDLKVRHMALNDFQTLALGTV